MDLREARELAVTLMHEHGLSGWRFMFDKAKTRAGQCRFDRREISLSATITPLLSYDEVRETILHEIAHALVGPTHNHDRVWRDQARALGAEGNTRLSTQAKLPRLWTGTCPRGHQVNRHRRPARPLSCGQCSRTFEPAAMLTWTFKGRAVPMTPAYRAAERAARMRAGLLSSKGA